MLAGAFAAPFLRVEYLTWRYGEQLRAAYVKEAGKGTSKEVLFSVFDHSSEQATVLRVEGPTRTMGYFLDFRREGDAWVLEGLPQAVLWSDAGSAFVACPYPAAVLLLSRGVVSAKC